MITPHFLEEQERKRKIKMVKQIFPILGADTPTMIGRSKIMQRIISDLTKPTPSHLSVVGPRYSGKSVLLKELNKIK